MRKRFRVVFLFFAFLVLLSTSCNCNECDKTYDSNKEYHWKQSNCNTKREEHDYEIIETIASTCDKAGTITKKCKVCGWIYKESIQKKAHELVYHDGKDPTCTESGHKEYYYCTKCNKYYTNSSLTIETTYDNLVIKAKHNIVHHDALDPTCTEPGHKAYDACTRCDYTTYEEIASLGHSYSTTWSYNTNKHYHECSCGDKNDIGSHSFIWVIDKKATVESTGLKHQECEICKYEINKYTVIPKLDHTHNMTYVEHQEETCTEDGHKEYYYCTKCNKYYTNSSLTIETTYDNLVIKAKHNIVHHEALDPTCTEPGHKAYDTCTRCDYTTYEEIASLGHNYTDYVVLPTTEEKGYTKHVCSNCNDTYNDTYVDKIPTYVLNVSSNNEAYGNVSEYSSNNVENQEITLIANPSKYYHFVGWYNEETLLSNDLTFIFKMPNSNYNIEARFAATLYNFKVTSLTNAIISNYNNLYKYDDLVTLTIIVDDGFDFVGWYNKEILLSTDLTYSFNYPEGDLEITPKIEGKSYTLDINEKINARIKFNSMGGSSVPDVVSSEFDYPIPTLDNYLFTGWYLDMNCTKKYDFNGELNGELTLYAGWVANTSEYKIDINRTITNISAPSKSSTNKKYYAFVSLVSGTIVIYSSSTSDTYGYLYDKNKNQLKTDDDSGTGNNFKIEYEVVAGELYYIAPCGYNGNVTLSLTVEGLTPTTNVILNTIDTVIVKNNVESNIPFLVKEGYNFDGYYTQINGEGNKVTDENGKFLTSNVLTENIKIYSHYIPKTYQLNLNYDNESENTDLDVIYDNSYTLPSPTKNTFTFKGWYYNDILVDGDTWKLDITSPIELVAKWDPIKIASISIEDDIAFEYKYPKLLNVIVNPLDGHYSKVVYELVSSTYGVNPTINDNILTVENMGELTIKVKLLDEFDVVVYSEDVEFLAFSTDVSSIDIINSENVILDKETGLKIETELFPSTSIVKGDYEYQLQNNTCNATIENGILYATQSGSVRVRVRVDDSDWSTYKWFYVPTVISTPTEFNNIRNDLSGYYILNNDINLSEFENWNPIGYVENKDNQLTYDNAFKGYVNGNGYKITGLSIDISLCDYATVGLFGAIDNSARVINLNIENYKITGITENKVLYVGGLAGIINGKTDNCQISGEINVMGPLYVGGVTGHLFGQINNFNVNSNIYVEGFNTEDIKVGGVVGYYSNGIFSNTSINTEVYIGNSYSFMVGGVAGLSEAFIEEIVLELVDVKGYSTSGTSYAGLYVGKTTYNELNNINVSGNLEVSSSGTIYAGGLVGYANEVKNSSVNVELTLNSVNNAYIGGLAGYTEGNISNIESNIIINDISATNILYVGGIVGYTKGKIQNITYKTDKVKIVTTSDLYFGGISGYSLLSIDNIDSTVNANLKAKNIYAGGISGYANSTITNSIYYGNIYINSKSIIYAGGISGYAKDIIDCQAYSVIDVNQENGNIYIGGIVGQSEGQIETIYFFGYINLQSTLSSSQKPLIYVGGTAGLTNSNIQDVDVNATINVDNKYNKYLYVGGIVGKTTSLVRQVKTDGTISVNNEYITYVGGLVGYSKDITKSYSTATIKTNVYENYELYTGGLVGYQGGEINECYYSFGEIYASSKGKTYLGGISGYANNTISNSYSSYSYILTDMSKIGTISYTGGITGYNIGTIFNSYTMLSLDGKADGNDKTMYIGGLAGYNSGTIDASFTKSASNEYIRPEMKTYDIETTAISDANIYAGGAVGCNNGSVINTIAENVLQTRNSYTGGFVGDNKKTISNSICFSEIKGVLGDKVGGFVGIAESSSTFTGCYLSITNMNNSIIIGTGDSTGIQGKTNNEFKLVSNYSTYDETKWIIKSGSFPKTKLDDDIWNDINDYKALINIKNNNNQHLYPIPSTYSKITFNTCGGEFPVDNIYIQQGESLFLITEAKRIGYIFKGWYLSEDYKEEEKITGKITSFPAHCTLYAKWEAIEYNLEVEIDGIGTVNIDNITYIYKDEIILQATIENLENYFVGWYDGETLLSSEVTYTYIGEPNDKTIIAKYLSYYDFKVTPNKDTFGNINLSEDNRFIETFKYTVIATPNNNHYFFGWFVNDTLISTEEEYTFEMPSQNYSLEARFVSVSDIWDGSIATSLKGSGTEKNPYLISTGAELAYLAKLINEGNTNYNSKYYELTNNISLNNLEWTPIGITDSSSLKYFSGNFNGKGYTISDFKITNEGNYTGLFGYTSGTISNIYVSSYIIDVSNTTTSDTLYVGGLVGCASNSNSSVQYCYATGNVTASSTEGNVCAGGLVGYAPKISNSYATGNVTASSTERDVYAGGLVGRVLWSNSSVQYCYATGNVTASSTEGDVYAGGLVGYTNESISNSYATGNVIASSTSGGVRAGGLTGGSTDSISNSYATGNVIASSTSGGVRAGGLVGYTNESISNSYATGNVEVSIDYSSSSLNVGGLVGYSSGGIYNSYRYENQIIKKTIVDQTTYGSNSYGSTVTSEQLQSKEFYTKTLSWNTSIWDLDKLIEKPLNTKYYQLFIESGEGGTINTNDAIVKTGDYVYLVAIPEEGHEFVGWINDEGILCTDAIFKYYPTYSSKIYAEFDIVRYNLNITTEDGITLSEYSKRNYENAEVSITATLKPGYELIGWYNGDILLTTDLTYTFKMPSNTLNISLKTKAIVYTLTMNKTHENSSDISYTVSYNVNNYITILGTLNPGYRFIGLYDGDTLLTTNLSYAFRAEAKNYNLTFKTELINYTLKLSTTTGGTFTDISGIYTVEDDIKLSAFEDETYQFLGWYEGDSVYTTALDLTQKMPTRDLTLVGKFEIGHVYINVVSSFNGYAVGSTSILKDREATITATPNEGYYFAGWQLGDEIVSYDATYTALYSKAGKYNYYALFKEDNTNTIKFYPNNGTAAFEETIIDASTYILPYMLKEGYIFNGWYTDKLLTTKFDYDDILKVNMLYASYVEITDTDEFKDEIDEEYSFIIYSRETITKDNYLEYISILSNNDETVKIAVTKESEKGYYKITGIYTSGGYYEISIIDDNTFFTNGKEKIVFAIQKEEIESINLTNSVKELNTSDIVVFSGNTLETTLTDININDYIAFAYNDEEYVKKVVDVNSSNNNLVLTLSEDEIKIEDIYSDTEYKNNDVNFSLDDANVIGDVDEALNELSNVVLETQTIKNLRRKLNTLSESNVGYVFDSPKIDKDNTYFKVEGKEIILKVTILINGKRTDKRIEKKVAIRIVTEIRNKINVACDLDIDFKALKLNTFKLSVTNESTISFNLDAIYGDKNISENFDALQTLLKEYKESTKLEDKVPFDLGSKFEDVFTRINVDVAYPLGSTGLFINFSVAPFVRYKLLGQLDIDTTVKLTNELSLIYINNEFKVNHNFTTDRNISIYALAYLNFEPGLNFKFDVYTKFFKKVFNIGLNFDLGFYLTTSGALVYEDGNVNFDGFIEEGVFYDADVHITLFGKKFESDNLRVNKRLALIGNEYLYFDFINEEEFIVEEYSIDLYDKLDLDLYAFDLRNLVNLEYKPREEEYNFILEENEYVYLKNNKLFINQLPTYTLTLELKVIIKNKITKIVKLSFDVKKFEVICESNYYGYITSNKSSAFVGETVEFIFNSTTKNVIVEKWFVNGEEYKNYSNTISVKMPSEELVIQVFTKKLSNVKYIYSVEDFKNIKNNMSATYIQMADIDFEGEIISPIGVTSQYILTTPFTGSYYGNGFKIKNFKITEKTAIEIRQDPSNFDKNLEGRIMSLFAYTSGAIFNGVQIENCTLEGEFKFNGKYDNAIIYAGGLTGISCNTTFANCSIQNSVINIKNIRYERSNNYFKHLYSTNYIGGLTALNYENVLYYNCYTNNNTITSYLDGDDTLKSKLIFGRDTAVIGGICGQSLNKLTLQYIYTNDMIYSYSDNDFMYDYSYKVHGRFSKITMESLDSKEVLTTSTIVTSEHNNKYAGTWSFYSFSLFSNKEEKRIQKMLNQYNDSCSSFSIEHFDQMLWNIEDDNIYLKVYQFNK